MDEEVVEAAGTSVAGMITQIGSVFTAAIGWMGTVASTVASNPILFVPVIGIPLCGLGIGMFRRIIRTRA